MNDIIIVSLTSHLLEIVAFRVSLEGIYRAIAINERYWQVYRLD